MKVLVATEKPFAAVAVDGIRELLTAAGHELVLLEKYTEKSQLLEAAATADAMIIRSDKATAEVIEAAKNLKIIVRAGAGYDNIDLQACTAHGIVAMNTPGQNSNAVAELVIAMMIYMCRNQFTAGTGHEISGKRMGIQAYGHIGKLVAAKAKALGMDVMVYSSSRPAEEIRRDGYIPAADLKELYANSDFVSVHIPSTPETKASIGYELINELPMGGCLLNSARKEIINEAELVKILGDRPDLKYATDIAPDCMEELKEKFGNRVFATPKKMGAQTAEANINAGLAAARQIIGFFATGCTEFQVNK